MRDRTKSVGKDEWGKRAKLIPVRVPKKETRKNNRKQLALYEEKRKRRECAG
jgi:hypothetical protein